MFARIPSQQREIKQSPIPNKLVLLPYLFVTLNTIIPKVINPLEIYLWIGILSPVGKIVLKSTIIIIFEDFINIFTGYEINIKAD